MSTNIISYLAFMLILLYGCKQQPKTPGMMAEQAILIDTIPGSAPFLTTDSKGNILISWAGTLNDSTAAFCYAASNDGGKTFSKPKTIPFSEDLKAHSENLPKIIRKPTGELICLWGISNTNPKNKYSGLVQYCQSFDNGFSWTKPVSLITDTASYDQRYYDVSLLPDGEVAIVWLDNRKKTSQEGSSLYFATTQGRLGFRNERCITEGCCQCCRTDLYVGRNADIHVLFRGIIKDSIRDMLHSVSSDGGLSFATPQLISNDNWVLKGCPHTGPSMTENKDGIHFAWFTGGKNYGCRYTRSVDNGKSFINPDQISKSGSHPQIASLTNGNLIMTWDEKVQINNNFHSRIVVQKRNSKGIMEEELYLTDGTLSANYPVVTNTIDGAAIIAYTEKKGDRYYIKYQRIIMN